MNKIFNFTSILIIFYVIASCGEREFLFESALNKEAEEILDIDDDKAIELAKTSLKKNFNNENNYYSHFIISYAYKNKHNYTESLKHLLKALSLIPIDAKFDANRASIHKNIGRIFEKYSEFNMAEEYYQNALKSVPQEERAGVLLNLGHLFKESGNLEKSADFYLDALYLAEQFGQQQRIVVITNQLALVRIRIGEYVSARELLYKIIALKESGKYDKYVGRAFHNIGHSFFEQGLYQKSLINYKQALNYKKAKSEKFITLLDIGQTYNKLEMYDSALIHLSTAESIYSAMQQTPENFVVFKFLQETTINLGSIDTSQKHLKKFYEAQENYQITRNQVNNYNNAVKIKKVIDDYYMQEKVTSQISLLTNTATLFIIGFIISLLFLIRFIVKRKTGRKILLEHIR
ncbi:MAG: hypothetical protein WBA74_00395 [Cyclobacteriaceae bacterium]